MFAHRSTVESSKNQGRAAQENQETTRNIGSHMTAQVELSAEGRQDQAFEEHQMLMCEIK